MKDVKFYKNVKNNNDEYYTPLYAVTILDKYIKPNSTIWCPFDTDDSEFVKHFKEIGHKVINTHIFNGEDFFSIDVPECDYIISNPPFSRKVDVLDRLFNIGKPFAMLLGDGGLFGSKRKFEMFKNNKFELLIPNKRVAYIEKDSGLKNSPPYLSIYVCSKLLDKQIVFDEFIIE